MRRGWRAHSIALVLALLGMGVFLAIVVSLIQEGLPAISWRFLTGWSTSESIGPELLNTLVMVGMTLIVTIPLGLMTAIYQEEYHYNPAKKRVATLSRVRATLLSAPTIVVALVVYRIAVGWWHWPVSVLTGVLTLSVINWPFLATLSAQALRGVPDSYRQASLALGASRLQTTRGVVLPAALGFLVEGWGLAFARLAGESAALIVTAGVNVSRHWSLFGPGETLAVHIWYIRTEGVSLNRGAEAAATGVVLMALIAVVVWAFGRLSRLLGGAQPPSQEVR